MLEEQWQPVRRVTAVPQARRQQGADLHLRPERRGRQPHHRDPARAASRSTSAATYSVGANSFLAAGGDNFLTLAKGTGKADSGKVDLESMVDYFAEFSTATPDLKQRAVGVAVQGDGTYAPGESVTVNLSSLDFSRTETAAGTVEVSFGGQTLATATVDRTYTPTVDEIGRATVTFTVPAGLSGVRGSASRCPAPGRRARSPCRWAEVQDRDEGAG